MRQKQLRQSLLGVTCILVLSGCASVRHAVPEDLVGRARILGMPDIRYYAGKPDSYPMVRQSLVDSFKEEDKSEYIVNGIKTYSALLIGGGVSNSAYGIGLLQGWSKSGSRPIFKIITGYSSGSIIAIATFAGKEYEGRIAELFTSISSKDVLKKRNMFSILFGDSVSSSAPLAKRIDELVDEDLLAKIAQEHSKGRRLYVGTTDFDAQGFVIWDMGALASKGGPDSVKLFRKIILASCSFPAMVPPVYFQVEAGGRRYDEMHVDGGVVSGLFYVYQLMEGAEFRGFETRLYVLNLCYMSPHSQQVEDNMVAMTSRLIETNGAAKMIGDTYRIYAYAKEKGWDYNLAYIPEDFKPNQKEMLDKQEMRRLFKRGYDDSAKGYKWHKAPPGLLSDGK